MYINLLKAEIHKLKRNKLLYAIFLLPFFSIGVQFCVFFYKKQVTSISWKEYIAMNHGFFPCFLYIFLSIFYYIIVCSEYNYRTWGVMFTTPIKKRHIFIIKWIVGNISTLLSLLLGSLLLYLSALILGFNNIPIKGVIYFSFSIWLGTQAMIAILCTLSIMISNGIFLVGIGIITSFLYLQYNNQKFIPFSYPAWTIGQNLEYGTSSLITYSTFSIVVTLITLALGALYTTKKDF
ncbi:ABC transporter permease [Priestia sp. FSL R5-0597]|uniref:ABC transporter permease n=1 Tax=Priestia TaxID=2800373 RepID=UPI001649AEB6|nr:ABC transporter permease [Priestia megaterium]